MRSFPIVPGHWLQERVVICVSYSTFLNWQVSGSSEKGGKVQTCLTPTRVRLRLLFWDRGSTIPRSSYGTVVFRFYKNFGLIRRITPFYDRVRSGVFRYTMRMHEWTVEAPARLDIFLANAGAVSSRVKAKDVVKAGHVMVNGRVVRKVAMVLTLGDVVQMSKTEEPVTETRLKGIDLKLKVLYEDDACMVINKPEGYAVHPGAGMPADEPTILHGIVHLFKERKIPFTSASVLVHRLDKETTGCLLIAKTPAAHKTLQKQFEDRTVRKVYLAIVAGVPNPPSAIIQASIGRSTANRTKMTVFGSSKTREAKTTYRTIDATKEAALLACELHTGRTHQIRVHLNTIGHSILGDPTYVSSQAENLCETFDIHDLCLHAWQLSFHSPADNKEHAITAPPSKMFHDALTKSSLTLH